MAIITYEGKRTHEGCVLRTWERNGAWDSDFYASVVNLENGTLEDIEYDTTRFGGGGNAVVDLTEVNWRTYLRKSFHRVVAESIRADQQLSREVDKGKRVRVIKGRKVPHGTEGVVFWIGSVNYDPYKRIYNETKRIGFKADDGKVYWTDVHNVEVVDPLSYQTSPQVIVKALKAARSNQFQNFKRIYGWA